MSDHGLKVYLNGEFVPAAEAKVSVFDHSFLYGDGVFEGIRVDEGAIFKLDEHVERLYRSARFIALDIPIPFEEMREAIAETVRVNKMPDGYIRPIVTRGEGSLGIEASRSLGRPNIVILPQVRRKFDATIRTERGLKGKIVSTRQKPPQSLDPRIKSCNYLVNILAKLEQWAAGAEVGIMLDVDGHVTEGCSENLFCVQRGEVLTPPAFRVLDGITRRTILEEIAPRVPVPARETDLTPYDLYTADEVFVTGTLTEVVPVIEIDGRPVGSGKPGPMTLKLLELLQRYMKESAVRVL